MLLNHGADAEGPSCAPLAVLLGLAVRFGLETPRLPEPFESAPKASLAETGAFSTAVASPRLLKNRCDHPCTMATIHSNPLKETRQLSGSVDM
jgi:hypothetical protein